MGKTRRKNKKYSAEFKISVILDMRENNLNYHEVVRKYCLGNAQTGGACEMLKRWEYIYLEEGVTGLAFERRGRARKVDNPNKGRPRKNPLPTEVESDLIAENQQLKEKNQYLEMELEYLKKPDALVRAEEQKNGRKPK